MMNPLMRSGAHIEEMLSDRPEYASRAARSTELRRRLAEVGITGEDVPHRMPFQLSGGMCQRVALAAALARDPELLIADEPSTALDVTTQAEIMKLLKRVQVERGMSMILITHDLRLAFSTCDRVYVLYAGSLLEVGDAKSVERDPHHPYTLGLLLSEPPAERRVPRLIAIRGSVPRPDDVAGPLRLRRPLRLGGGDVPGRQSPRSPKPRRDVVRPAFAGAKSRRQMRALRRRALEPAGPGRKHVQRGAAADQRARSGQDLCPARRAAGSCAEGRFDRDRARRKRRAWSASPVRARPRSAAALSALKRPPSGTIEVAGIPAADYAGSLTRRAFAVAPHDADGFSGPLLDAQSAAFGAPQLWPRRCAPPAASERDPETRIRASASRRRTA